MEKQQIQQLFNNFLVNYDTEAKDAIWQEQSSKFRNFWQYKILGNREEELNDVDVDDIIRILDRNGRGNTRESEAIARAMIAQGAYRRMFNEMHQNKELSDIISLIMSAEDGDKKAELIDKLYKMNEGRKNGLTGPSGNAICDMLAAWDPFKNLSVISLNERKKLSDFFQITNSPDFDKDSIGSKIVMSNKAIMDYFIFLGLNFSARTISRFFYSPEIKPLWREEISSSETKEDGEEGFVAVPPIKEYRDPALFYMESQLEDFLVENWEKTELGQRYDLNEEEGELRCQQYKTGIGKIDILAKDRKTNQYVVIELKKDQTSDDTIGQIARYMGWLEENKTNSKSTKGIIIAARYDEKLNYALKKLKDVEVYLYKVDFKLEEFKEK